jgi:palmitoyltransferase
MKHCHDCQRCVATFDHHCLWLDNCIGEKNRPVFYLCLWANLAEISHAVIAMVVEMYRAGEWFPYQIAFLSFAGVVGTGVALLAFLHTYLMAANITTCT